MAYLTGYKFTTVVNEQLKAKGLKEIPAQMIYQYIQKGRIESEVIEGKNQVDTEGAGGVWLKGYIEMRRNKEAKKAAKLEAELAGATAE